MSTKTTTTTTTTVPNNPADSASLEQQVAALKAQIAAGGSPADALFGSSPDLSQATPRGFHKAGIIGYDPSGGAKNADGSFRFSMVQQLPASNDPGAIAIQQSAADWQMMLYRMTPQQLAAFQKDLFAHGWYRQSTTTGYAQVTNLNEIKLGRVDDLTLNALGSALMETARHQQVDPNHTLQDVINMGSPNAIKPKKGTAAGASRVRPMDPSAIQDAFQQTVSGPGSLTEGYGISPQEQAQFVSQYQGQEAASRQAQANAAQIDPNTGQSVGNPYAIPNAPSADVAARQYELAHNQADIKAYTAAYNALHFSDMLKNIEMKVV